MSRGANACRSSESSMGRRWADSFLLPAFRFLLLVVRGDGRLDAAARRELALDRHPLRLAGGDEIVEDLVGGALVEDAFVAVVEQVVLQRLQLDAAIGR